MSESDDEAEKQYTKPTKEQAAAAAVAKANKFVEDVNDQETGWPLSIVYWRIATRLGTDEATTKFSDQENTDAGFTWDLKNPQERPKALGYLTR